MWGRYSMALNGEVLSIPLSPSHSLEDWFTYEDTPDSPPTFNYEPVPSIPPPEPIPCLHTSQQITYPLFHNPVSLPQEYNNRNMRGDKRRRTEKVPMMPQFNPALSLELVGNHPPHFIPTVPVAHTISVASILVRVKGIDPFLERHPFCNEFIILSRFFLGETRVEIPGDGLAVSTFHMTKDTGTNRNAFWAKETRTARFHMKILFSPRSDEERRLSVQFQLCHQHGPGQFTAITSWVHLVDLYITPANLRLSNHKSKSRSKI